MEISIILFNRVLHYQNGFWLHNDFPFITFLSLLLMSTVVFEWFKIIRSHRVQSWFDAFQIMSCDRSVFAESYEMECCLHAATIFRDFLPFSFSPNQYALCPSESIAATAGVEDVDLDVNVFSVVVLVGIVLVLLTSVIICFVKQRRAAIEWSGACFRSVQTV